MTEQEPNEATEQQQKPEDAPARPHRRGKREKLTDAEKAAAAVGGIVSTTPVI